MSKDSEKPVLFGDVFTISFPGFCPYPINPPLLFQAGFLKRYQMRNNSDRMETDSDVQEVKMDIDDYLFPYPF
jgi:hypothetical protein